MTQVEAPSRIAALNDALRTMFCGGSITVTQGIMALPEETQRAILETVRTFNDFSEDNDPYGEHDFGAFWHQGIRINWKIDYYAPDYLYHSEDPADPVKTRRVLTIMLADEY